MCKWAFAFELFSLLKKKKKPTPCLGQQDGACDFIFCSFSTMPLSINVVT